MPQDNPLVSVIIPCYNHARFLPERMESVLGQTYRNFEVIILDDCSSDNSREVIEQYRTDPHVTNIVYNEQNSGSPFKQWHKGIGLAKGDIIWIAESDDSCGKDLLSELVPIYVNNNCSLAFARSLRMDEEGHIHGKVEYQNDLSESINMSGRRFIESYLYEKNLVMNASSAIFCKKAALKADKQYMEYKGSGDWLFWIEIAEQGNVSFLDKPLNHFRLHSCNTTLKQNQQGQSFAENKQIFDYLVNNNLISLKKSIKRRSSVFYKLRWNKELQNKNELLRLWGFQNPVWRCLYELMIIKRKVREKLWK